ncbi:hypothetical protein CEXT_593661 [Caerostris extrusa]|uniref:non-specific serine/threonine protein kinase n=1 Tax=Caerostris extrusa TaxID=172846 RepID=A0AAV4VEB3_CAEEX|nr:hypothetical protein CEXT_593661 [Caerostris extrusa]
MSRYEKEGVIGSGTFGSVWLVKSKLSRHTYVMKEINLKSLTEKERKQAITEVAVLSKCKHKHIIRYKEAIVEQNLMLSIVMEYAEGGDLHASILRQKGVPFSEHRVISWFIQICLALQYIHFENILHRDLKTQNIFLTRNNLVKVGDFGISRVLKCPEELAETAIGTPYYLSPEVYQRKPYNHKSDIWALGCILFELSALEQAFKAEDFMHLVTLIIKGNRKELPSHCCSLIRDLVDALLKNDPKERPSIEEILANRSLQPYLSDYMLTYSTRESYLPVLISPKEPTSRRSSASDVFQNLQDICMKRTSSVSTLNPRTARKKSANKPEINNFRKGKSASKLLSSRSSSMALPETKNEINDRTFSVSKPKFTFRLDKAKQSYLTLSCDNYSAPSPQRLVRPPSKLCKSEDATLSEIDYGYQSEEMNSNSSSGNSCASNSQYKLSKDEMNRGFCMSEDEEFLSNGSPKEIKSNNDHQKCHHSQCHRCMLDMLWRNRIRYCVQGSVNADEYRRLRHKLLTLYKEKLFKQIHQSLLRDWERNENPNNLLSMMHSLNYEQVQSLPLMMQLVQLDILMKPKQNGQKYSQDIKT